MQCVLTNVNNFIKKSTSRELFELYNYLNEKNKNCCDLLGVGNLEYTKTVPKPMIEQKIDLF